MRASDWLWALTSTNVALPMTVLGLPDQSARNCTSWPGSGYGSGLSRTALTTLKMAVFAPMPSASVSTATAVKPGCFNNWRMANLRSFITQRLHRIDFRGPARRQPAGEQCDGYQEQGDRKVGDRVAGADAYQQA